MAEEKQLDRLGFMLTWIAGVVVKIENTHGYRCTK